MMSVKQCSLRSLLLLPALLGLGIWGGLACLGSALLQKAESPASLCFPVALVCVATGGYVACLLAAKRASDAGRNPFVGAFACAGVLLLLLVALSLAFSVPGRSLPSRFGSPCVLLLSASLAGLTVATRKPKQNRRLKKLMRRRPS